MIANIAFDNSYARLPGRFHAPWTPAPVPGPRMVRLNTALAAELGLDPRWLETGPGLAMLAGNAFPKGAEPVSQAYAGHQFGNFVPQLGDGRALLVGEVIDRNGQRRDIQLKGSGPTPWSRNGDGRAALGPVLREYIVSEAMHALGIPTTRSLAAVMTGAMVHRETRQPGAVLARVAASHVRVGTFQYFYVRRDTEALRLLADHVIDRHWPGAREADNTALALLYAVIGAQADLVARWLGVGFIHGVMNTDNMLLSGETIDYGPCAFMDSYHPNTVYSSIDQFGRYAYANQPPIAQWNLAQLAQALLPLIDDDQEKAVALAQGAIEQFPDMFTDTYERVLRAKLGLQGAGEDDLALAQDLLKLMAEQAADMTNTFRALSGLTREAGDPDARFMAEFQEPAPVIAWLGRWRARLARKSCDDASRIAAMKTANPAVIPRNHRIEQAIKAAHGGDFGPFHALTEALERPFDDRPAGDPFTLPPKPDEVVHRTFCGT